jgi:hypothetical protein
MRILRDLFVYDAKLQYNIYIDIVLDAANCLNLL